MVCAKYQDSQVTTKVKLKIATCDSLDYKLTKWQVTSDKRTRRIRLRDIIVVLVKWESGAVSLDLDLLNPYPLSLIRLRSHACDFLMLTLVSSQVAIYLPISLSNVSTAKNKNVDYRIIIEYFRVVPALVGDLDDSRLYMPCSSTLRSMNMIYEDLKTMIRPNVNSPFVFHSLFSVFDIHQGCKTKNRHSSLVTSVSHRWQTHTHRLSALQVVITILKILNNTACFFYLSTLLIDSDTEAIFSTLPSDNA